MTTTLLPAFPLDIVVLPGEDQYLHIFEERYLQLINELKVTKGEFAIPYSENGKLNGYGVLVKIDSVFGESPEGTLYISVSGTRTFKLKNLIDTFPGKLYPAAEIEPGDKEVFPEDQAALEELRPRFIELLKMFRNDQSQVTISSLKNSYFAATLLRLPLEKKLQLISISKEKDRVKWISNELKLAIIICNAEQELQGQYFLN
jgi:Lon protease-like protein